MKVSVAVITYNHEKFIKSCLEGILKQETNFDYEIIIGEDASTDNTASILKEYANKFPQKIKLKLRNPNIGAIPNFADVISSCSGIFIAFCEGDDYWTDPLKLQKQVDFLEVNSDYGICFHNVEKFYEGESEGKFEKIDTSMIPETTSIDDLAKLCYIVTNSAVLRNNFVLPKWFSKLPIGDWPLFLFQIKNKKVKKLNDYMSVYRLHKGGIWSSTDKIKKLNVNLKTIKPLLDHAGLPESANKILRKKYRRNKLRLITKKIKKYFKK